MNNVQKYYLPEPTPWPIFGCSALLMMAVGAAAWVNRAAAGLWLVSVGVVLLLIMLIGWFGTVIRENNAGLLNRQVDASFRWAMAWFVFSEVMVFVAFFGALFYLRVLAPGDYRYKGADLGVIVARGRMQGDDLELTPRCLQWVGALRASFAGVPVDLSPAYEPPAAFKS